MTQEEKELLLKDLSARLPYGVIVDNPNPAGGAWDEVIDIDASAKKVTLLYNGRVFSIDEVKPYLRPMSSMTDEELKDFQKNSEYEYREAYNTRAEGEDRRHIIQADCNAWTKDEDFLNSHYFDYRGLIEKGLALEAPEGMYKSK